MSSLSAAALSSVNNSPDWLAIVRAKVEGLRYGVVQIGQLCQQGVEAGRSGIDAGVGSAAAGAVATRRTISMLRLARSMKTTRPLEYVLW